MAAVRNVRILALAMLMVVGVSILGGSRVSAQDCSNDIQGLITNCQQYVTKLGPKARPSGACCNVVKSVDFPCLCKKVTPVVETLISIEKVIYVAATCGRPIPPGTKCGSITTPPPLV